MITRLFRQLCILVCILFLGALTYAQQFTLQGGNFQLVGGGPVANGTVTLTLSIASGATVCATAGTAQVTYIFTLDANGNFPAGSQVTGNGAICPAGSFYTAVVKTAGGTPVGSPAVWIVGPSSAYTGTLFPSITVQPLIALVGSAVGAFEIIGSSGLPAATNTNLWCAGSFGFPILGKCYVGDGTGWEMDFAKRTGSSDTSLFKLKDSGEFTSVANVITTRGDRQISLQNPDFEGSSSLPPPGWTTNNNPTLSYETSTQAPSKKQSLKITYNGNTFPGVLTATSYSVVPGDQYSVTFAVKSDGTLTAQGGLVWNDKNGATVSSSLSTATASTSWITQTVSATVPATAVQMIVILQGTGNPGGSVWFDQVSVQKTNFPAPVMVNESGSTNPLSITRTDSGSVLPIMSGSQSASAVAQCYIPLLGGTHKGWFVGTQENLSDNFEIFTSTATGNCTPNSSDAMSMDASGNAKFAGVVNAVNGFQVNGTALAASNLSNGVTGSGPVCLGTSCNLTTPSINGTTISNVPLMAWTCVFPGNSDGNAACPMIFPSGITVLRVLFEIPPIGTGPAGCATAPTVTVRDFSTTTNVGTALTIPNGQATNSPVLGAAQTTNLNTTDTYDINITAGSGCATRLQGATATVLYRMQ
jgi:hypothetical protein